MRKHLFIVFIVFTSVPAVAVDFFPYPSEVAFRKAAEKQIKLILNNRVPYQAEIVDQAITDGDLIGITVSNYQTGQDKLCLISWVERKFPEKERVTSAACIDLGDYDSIDKLISRAKTRVELVLSDLKMTYDEGQYGLKIADAISNGSLPGAAIYKYKMTRHPDNDALEAWVQANLIESDDT